MEIAIMALVIVSISAMVIMGIVVTNCLEKLDEFHKREHRKTYTKNN